MRKSRGPSTYPCTRSITIISPAPHPARNPTPNHYNKPATMHCNRPSTTLYTTPDNSLITPMKSGATIKKIGPQRYNRIPHPACAVPPPPLPHSLYKQHQHSSKKNIKSPFAPWQLSRQLPTPLCAIPNIAHPHRQKPLDRRSPCGLRPPDPL